MHDSTPCSYVKLNDKFRRIVFEYHENKLQKSQVVVIDYLGKGAGNWN
jgi:hypothetical protein